MAISGAPGVYGAGFRAPWVPPGLIWPHRPQGLPNEPLGLTVGTSRPSLLLSSYE
jgi:hypothetical protein